MLGRDDERTSHVAAGDTLHTYAMPAAPCSSTVESYPTVRRIGSCASSSSPRRRSGEVPGHRSAGHGGNAPGGVQVRHFLPARDASAADCLWEAKSLDAIRDETFGRVASSAPPARSHDSRCRL